MPTQFKEIIIYSGLAVYVSKHAPEAGAWLVVAVAGSSILTSYIRARGETAITKKTPEQLNKLFSGGIARYEIRMVMLLVGLIATTYLAPILRLMLALNFFTAAGRFLEIARLLNLEDSKKSKKEK